MPVEPDRATTLIVPGGPSVNIPAGAVDGSGTLTAKVATNAAGVPDHIVAGTVWDLHVDGATITHPVTLTFPVAAPRPVDDIDQAPTGSPMLTYFDEQTQSWTPVQSSWDASSGTLQATTTHLSQWFPFTWDFQAITNSVTQGLVSVWTGTTHTDVHCDHAADLSGKGISVSSSDGEQVRWCAEPAGPDFVVRIANNHTYAVELSVPASWDTDRQQPDNDDFAALGADDLVSKLITPPAGRKILILGADHTIDVTVPAGEQGLIGAEPSPMGYLATALLFGISTLAMVYGAVPGAPKVTEASNVKVLQAVVASGDCLNTFRPLSQSDPTTSEGLVEIAGGVWKVAFSCLADQWERVYGPSGLVVSFVTGILSWLVEGPATLAAGVHGAIDTIQYFRGWAISITAAPATISSSDTGDYQQFVGSWYRHTSDLEITADMTGSVLFGSGCCNSISVPLTYRLDGAGSLIGTVSGPATYIGTSFKDVQLPPGSELTFTIGQNQPTADQTPGLIIVSSNPTGGTGPLIWCGPIGTSTDDARCGQ